MEKSGDNMKKKKTLTILLTKGPYVSEAADMAMKTALKAKRKGYNVNLFLYLDGTWVSHITQEKTFNNPSEWLKSVIHRGAEVDACERCSDARDIQPDRIMKGVKISGTLQFIEMLKTSDKVLTFGG
jgi:tRNA 2-thiouridine synthesizing protein D